MIHDTKDTFLNTGHLGTSETTSTTTLHFTGLECTPVNLNFNYFHQVNYLIRRDPWRWYVYIQTCDTDPLIVAQSLTIKGINIFLSTYELQLPR